MLFQFLFNGGIKEKLIARGSSATAGELEEVKEVKEVRCHCEEALRADAASPVE